MTLGDGADEFTWNPGDGNDHAGAGKDTLIFNGSDRAPSDGQDFETENLSFGSDGSRTTIRRDLTRQSPLPSELDVMSFSGFELVKTKLAGGPNSVFFADDFSGSDISVVRVDLGPPGERPIDPRQGPDTRNRASFVGTAGADRIRIGGTPATGATVTGLGPAVLITGPQILSISGEEGDDHDRLLGGGGDDRLEGRGGDDILDGGPGNNVIIP